MKKNLKNLKVKVEKLKQKMNEIEKKFYMELGKKIAEEIQKEDCSLEKLKEVYNTLKNEYGI